MKIVGLMCSPRKGGNTEILLEECLRSSRDMGAFTELIPVNEKDIKPCQGCFSCQNTGQCQIQDDMQEIYKKLLEADGIVFATPVYFWSMTGQAKVLLDRTMALRFPYLKLAHKVGGLITVAGRRGAVNTANIFQRYFIGSHMVSAECDVDGFAVEKGEIRKDKYAMKAAWELGRQMVLLIKKGFKFPEEYDLPMYMHVGREYNVSLSPIDSASERD